MAIKNLEQLKADIKYIIKFNFLNEAFLLINFLKKEFQQDELLASDREIYDLFYQLNWISLNRLSDNEVVDLFKNHFMMIFKIENFNIWDTFKSKLINIDLDNRDNFKQKIKKILEENQDRITSQKIIVNENISVPTVANWIKDYNIQIGGGKFTSSEKRNEYLAYNENIKKISKDERIRVRLLLDFYDRLGISSLTQEGYEEILVVNDGEGNKGFFSDGVFVKLDSKTIERIKNIQNIINGKRVTSNQNIVTKEIDQNKKLEELMKKYKTGSLERKAIEEELNKTAK